MLDTGNHTDRACLTIWNCFFEVCAATTFRPMIHLKLLSKLVIPLSLGVELFGASWNVQLLKRSKGHSKETKMQKKTILPHTCLPLALCACSCSANWNLLRVDFNSTLAGKLRTREHSHNVMQTRFFFFSGTQGMECELVGGRRNYQTYRSLFFTQTGAIRESVTQIWETLQIWPNRRDGVSAEVQYRQCAVILSAEAERGRFCHFSQLYCIASKRRYWHFEN